MFNPRTPSKWYLFLSLTLMTLLITCSKQDQVLGTYRPLPGSPPEFSDVSIEIRKGGEGIRRVRNQTVTFQWVMKGKEMRIHTDSGGTIIAQPQGDLMEVTFPNSQVVYFKKSPG
jgi:hypothetical protein